MFDYKELLKYLISEFNNFKFRSINNIVFLDIVPSSDIFEKPEIISYIRTKSEEDSSPFVFNFYSKREKRSHHVLGFIEARYIAIGKRTTCVTFVFNEEISRQMYLDGFYR